MTSQNDRKLLKSAYPGRRWSAKVDKMSDSQVIAVIRRLQAQKKL